MSFELSTLVKTTIIILCAGLTNLLLKHAAASTRHAIWTIALICGLVLPLADGILPQSAQLEIPLLPASGSAAPVIRNFVPDVATPVAPSPLGLPETLPLNAALSSYHWVAYVWILGFAFFLADS